MHLMGVVMGHSPTIQDHEWSPGSISLSSIDEGEMPVCLCYLVAMVCLFLYHPLNAKNPNVSRHATPSCNKLP
jgi:hypothetical protein